MSGKITVFDGGGGETAFGASFQEFSKRRLTSTVVKNSIRSYARVFSRLTAH